MASGWVVPLLAGVVAAAFAAKLWGGWSVRRRPHQLAWAIGLSLYAVASLIEAYAAAEGWSIPVYRAFFALAASNVGFLGLGTVLLVRTGAWGRVFALVVVAGALIAAIGQLAVPLDAGELDGTARHVPFPHPARWAFLLLNVVGGLALIGGAALSGWQTRRLGVLLIGVGAMLPFLGGTLSTVFAVDLHDLRILLQFLGIVVMFLGYLRGREATPRASSSHAQPEA